MTKKKSTKRALLMSALALVMCVSMLIGSTYAWFTDTATTSVNTIQSGTLEVALEYFDGTEWKNAEGITLNFKKAAAAPAGEAILWEPGCTYELPAIRVKNNGSLALKYEIVISGVNGSAKLLEAIEWTANDAELAAFTGELLTGAESNEIVIKGHMKEEAGNQYQGLTADGIGITVYATQLAHEFDSNGNDYDENAPEATQSQVNALAKELSEAKAGDTIYLGAMNYGNFALGSGAYAYDYPANLTIVGQEGTTFTGISIHDETISGWTFQNITFRGVVNDNSGNTDGFHVANTATVTGLTFDTCKFVNGAKISLVDKNGNATFEDVTIKNTSFENTDVILGSDGKPAPAILLQGVNNITVDNCTFTNAGYNAIQTNKMTGNAFFINNTITNTSDRAIRFSNTGANITVTGNTIVSGGDAAGELMKISGTNGTITVSGNTWNGKADSEVSAGMVGSDYIVK